MTSNWTTKAFSKNSTAVEYNDAMLQEKVVVLLQGKNTFDDEIYSYIQLTIEKLQEMGLKLKKSEQFMPSDFGTVLAAGKGKPPPELKSEMMVTYGLVDRPETTLHAGKPKKPKLPSFTVKDVGSHWDEN